MAIAVFLTCLAFLHDISGQGQLFADGGAGGNPPASRPYKNDAVLTKGKFLVATPKLAGSIFSETVILLIEYGPKGAQGVIINRPTHLVLSSILPELKALSRIERVYYGGPVSTNMLTFALIKASSPPENSIHVFGGVYSLLKIDDLKRVVGNTGRPFRVYAGYSGWAPDQLEAEVATGSWRVAQPDEDMLFSNEAAGILKTDYDSIKEGVWPRRQL